MSAHNLTEDLRSISKLNMNMLQRMKHANIYLDPLANSCRLKYASTTSSAGKREKTLDCFDEMPTGSGLDSFEFFEIYDIDEALFSLLMEKVLHGKL